MSISIHWPLATSTPLNMSISTIDNSCTWAYPSLITHAHEYIHYWPPVHMSISIIDNWQLLHMSISLHWPPLHMSIFTIEHYCTWAYWQLITPTCEHIHHWPPLHLSIYTIDNSCTWAYPPLTSSAPEHFTIDQLYTWAYPPLDTTAPKHIPPLTYHHCTS